MTVEPLEPPRTEPLASVGAAPLRPARDQSARSRAKSEVHRPWTAWAGRTLLGAAAHVPLRALHGLGRALGAVGARLPLEEVRVTRINLGLCFPELSIGEREDLARESLRQAGCMGLEIAHFWMRPVEEVLARVVEVRGEEHFQRALERGRGIIGVAPHLGAWELAGIWIGRRAKVTTMYRPPRVRELEALYTRSRERSGANLVPADAGGVRAVLEALRRGELTVFLPDQDPGRGSGVFVPFFGVAANTSTLPARIASKSGAAVLVAFVERLPRAAGYRLHILPGSEEIGCGDLERGARAMNLDIERCVRMAPAQYLWSYKRFKSRPPGEPTRYPDGD